MKQANPFERLPHARSGLYGPILGLRFMLLLLGGATLTFIVIHLIWEGVGHRFGEQPAGASILGDLRIFSTALVTTVAVSVIALIHGRQLFRRYEQQLERESQELERSQVLLKAVLDRVSDGLMVVAPDGGIVQSNRSARQIHGEALEEGRCSGGYSWPNGPCHECSNVSFQESGAVGPQIHTNPQSGEVLSLSCYRLELPGGKEYRLLVEQVITEQTKLRARLIHQEKMAAFGLLAAGIAHDMGNPLSSMDGQLRMLDVRELPEHAKQTIDVLHEQLGRLQRTLRELVDLARRRRDEASMVSVRTVVDSALRLISHDRRMRKIKLKTHSDPETPAVFMVEDHLTQVVMNLVINSLDAMPEGGDLNVDIRAVDDEVALRIHDSGIGMDRGTLKRCKEALFTTKEPGKGTGLGLSICKDILSAVGGGLELHSAPDRGTTVVVTIPGSTSEGDHSMPILDTTAVGGRTTEGAQPGAGATSPRGGQPG